jgi:hypothetical protein
MERKLESLKKVGMKATGQAELVRYWRDGKALTQQQAIKAKCYECCGYYADGKVSCDMPDCPLFAFHPYNPNKRLVRVKAKPKEVAA